MQKRLEYELINRVAQCKIKKFDKKRVLKLIEIPKVCYHPTTDLKLNELTRLKFENIEDL